MPDTKKQTATGRRVVHKFCISLDDEQKEHLTDLARRSDMSLGTYITHVLNGAREALPKTEKK